MAWHHSLRPEELSPMPKLVSSEYVQRATSVCIERNLARISSTIFLKTSVATTVLEGQVEDYAFKLAL
ncbi:hypothetical protein PT974_02800 [Cladobotryum mycophilum]|uniref:Uncharacterized protein n=1 Tax=Cladobotryum mycophilum TaxID=491253 RepID=A0ABR0SZZ5_9HYPO